MSKINKDQFVTRIAEKTGQTKTATDLFVDAFYDVVEECLKEGIDIKLVGKGTFEVTETKAHMGRNPKTNEEMMIEASVKAKATLSSNIKKSVKQALVK